MLSKYLQADVHDELCGLAVTTVTSTATVQQ
jgi:hypothetical protein